MLAGVDPRTGGDSYLVVELKQWSHAERLRGRERLVHGRGMHRSSEHPLLQVPDYCDYMADSSVLVDGRRRRLRGVAYLHNATDRDVDRPARAGRTTEQSRLFTKQRRGQLLDYLRPTSRRQPGPRPRTGS